MVLIVFTQVVVCSKEFRDFETVVPILFSLNPNKQLTCSKFVVHIIGVSSVHTSDDFRVLILFILQIFLEQVVNLELLSALLVAELELQVSPYLKLSPLPQVTLLFWKLQLLVNVSL